MRIELVPTRLDSVYLVKGLPVTSSLNYVAACVERHVDNEWPCPMMTYGATKYSVSTLRGRKDSRNVYARVGLT